MTWLGFFDYSRIVEIELIPLCSFGKMQFIHKKATRCDRPMSESETAEPPEKRTRLGTGNV